LAKFIVLLCQCREFDDTPAIIAVLPKSAGQIGLVPSCHRNQNASPRFEPRAQVGPKPFPYPVAIQGSVRLCQASDGGIDNDKIGSSSDYGATRANGQILAAVRQASLNRLICPFGKVKARYRLLRGNQVTNSAAKMGSKRFRLRC